MSRISAPPTKNPAAVPTRARSAVDPVAAALVLRTERVPSTTQNPCCTWTTSAMPTAAARATAPHMLLRNQAERSDACPLARPPATRRLAQVPAGVGTGDDR